MSEERAGRAGAALALVAFVAIAVVWGVLDRPPDVACEAVPAGQAARVDDWRQVALPVHLPAALSAAVSAGWWSLGSGRAALLLVAGPLLLWGAAAVWPEPALDVLLAGLILGLSAGAALAAGVLLGFVLRGLAGERLPPVGLRAWGAAVAAVAFAGTVLAVTDAGSLTVVALAVALVVAGAVAVLPGPEPRGGPSRGALGLVYVTLWAGFYVGLLLEPGLIEVAALAPLPIALAVRAWRRPAQAAPWAPWVAGILLWLVLPVSVGLALSEGTQHLEICLS